MRKGINQSVLRKNTNPGWLKSKDEIDHGRDN
jgi:hypothetical protein